MALAEGFSNTLEYFQEVVNVLCEYQWLYIRPNTDIFKNNLLDFMPIDWVNYFQTSDDDIIQNLGLGKEIPNAPEALNIFIKKIQCLKPQFQMNVENMQRMERSSKGLGLKKQHEITLLAPLILNLCSENEIEYVIDIGCGLGYLTRLLKDNKLNVMGIDGNAKFVETAQKKHSDIAFEHLYVTTASCATIIGLLKKHFPEFDGNIHNVCLVALHACADLTVDMLKLSLTMECIKVAVVMPCCYHRLKSTTNKHDEIDFVNFPLSVHLKQALAFLNGKETFLNRQFLRLACQRTNWKNQSGDQRVTQTKNLMYRNLLQLVAHQDSLIVQRRRRKTGSTNPNLDLTSFLSNIQASYEIHKTSDSTLLTDSEYDMLKESIKTQFQKTYIRKEPLIAAFAALQNVIQGICENLVLLDRCSFMNEVRDTCCVTVKVTDECVSPRCFALITTKQTQHKQ